MTYRSKYGHAGELFYNALSGMASNTDDIKTRLIAAFKYGLSGLRTDELPPSLWRRYKVIYDEVTAAPDAGAGSFSAAVSAMDEKRASEIARELFSIYACLVNEWY
jgi:hypothetical protein